MSFIDRYAHDKSAFEEGTWVPLGDKIEVKVRSPASAHSIAVRKKLEAPYANMVRGGRQLPDDVTDEILTKQLAQSLIMDWKGVDLGNGPEPANPANIERVLRDYPFFRDDVSAVIASRDTFKAKVLEDDAKN